jgi:hypothetical protein
MTKVVNNFEYNDVVKHRNNEGVAVADGEARTMFVHGCTDREGSAQEIEFSNRGKMGNSGIQMEKGFISFERKVV